MSASSENPRFKLTWHQRLRGATRIDQLYKTGRKRTAHPLTVHALERESEKTLELSDSIKHTRMGISIGRRCGTAVRRNLIKRRLREAFRHIQHEIPSGMDYLVVVKPHEPLSMSDYQLRLRQLMH